MTCVHSHGTITLLIFFTGVAGWLGITVRTPVSIQGSKESTWSVNSWLVGAQEMPICMAFFHWLCLGVLRSSALMLFLCSFKPNQFTFLLPAFRVLPWLSLLLFPGFVVVLHREEQERAIYTTLSRWEVLPNIWIHNIWKTTKYILTGNISQSVRSNGLLS